MAEESIYSLVTPQKNESNSMNMSENSAGNPVSLSTGHSTHANHRRASIGSYHAGDSSLRNSTEKSDSAKSSYIPNYLRASTGSCHDFCKYGREHSFEEKARKPLRKKIAKPLPEDLHSVEIFVSGGQKKEKVVNQRHPTDPKNHSHGLKVSPDTRSYSAKPKTSVNKEKSMKLKPSEDKKNHSPDVPSLTETYSRKSKMLSDAKTGNKTLVPKYKSLSAKKLPAAEPPEIVKSVFFPSTEFEDSFKQVSSIDDKMSRGEKEATNVTKQCSSPVKSKTIKVKPSSSHNSDGIRLKGRRNSNPETGRNLTALKAPVKKVLAAPAILSPKVSTSKPARVNSGKAGNLKLVAPQKDRRRVKTKISDNEKVSEKILHVIKMETGNNISESIPGNHAVSSLPSPLSPKSLSSANSLSSPSQEEDKAETEGSVSEADGFISDDNDSHEIVEVVPPVKENNSKTVRKSRVAASEDKHRPPVKLKFRAGKVVDPQSDNNGPRRLRFRRARVLSAGYGKGDLSRRTLKKAEVNNNATGAKVSSEKVVLKHQDVQDKKDAKGLFNNVIEETASKLVESRKSKVKALVGAFETVISLQENKPSSQVVS